MVDRRVRRTRRRLRDALIDLIMDLGYDNITIQNITDRADLSRATFYLHYKDKDELLANSLEEMFDELVDSLDSPIFGDNGSAGDQPGVLAFEHVAQYSDLYKALLLGDRGVTYVIYREIQYIAGIAKKQLAHLLPDDADKESLPVPLDVMAHHMAGALFSMILWWLENDMPYSPEQMGRMFHRMSRPAAFNAFGLPLETINMEQLLDE